MMTDQEFIDEETIDRYLLGQLSSEEAMEFECRYFSDPALLSRVELAQAMQRGLQNADELRRPPATSAAAVTQGARRGETGFWLGLVTSPLWSLSATAAVATLLLIGGAQTISSRQEIHDVAGTISLSRTRTVTPQSSCVTLAPAKQGIVLIGVATGLSEGSSGSLSITSSRKNTVVEKRDFRAQSNGVVRIGVPASALPSGQYTVTVAGGSASDLEYIFCVAGSDAH